MKEITVDAKNSNIDKVINFINNELDEVNCDKKIKMQIDVAIDEIFSNITNYAYNDKNGKATVAFDLVNDLKQIAITFIDEGYPYNPLLHEDPDVTLGINEREIGGLGIFIVKNSMDDVSYEYKDNKNILTIKKFFN